ncbi:MAG: phosphatase PAP2 family protein [Dechloromonas sp.]|nr:MAG: phosphatase PAP2 family protein [Dechloromonas sp.]
MSALLTHEWLFGAYMLFMATGLLLTSGLADANTLSYMAGLLIAGGLIALTTRRDTPAMWRTRLLFYPLAMNVYFQLMRSAVPAVHPARMDTALRQIDQWLLPDTPSLLLEPLVTPWATEAFSFFYILFLPYLAFSVINYAIGDLHRLRAFTVGLFSLYGIGFLGYALVPAGGPYLAFPQEFTVPLLGGPITQWNAVVVGAGSNGIDVFPSLHVAVSSFLLGFDFRHRRRRFWVYLVPCVGLWLSTLYLRYHYLVDLLFGFALATLALWLAERQFARERIPA